MNKSSLRAFLFIYGHLHVCIGFSLIVGWDSWWCPMLRFPFRRRIALVATTIDIVTAHTWWHTQAGATMTCCQWSEWDQEKFVRKNDFSEYLGRCSDLPRFPDDKAEQAIPSLYIEFIQNGMKKMPFHPWSVRLFKCIGYMIHVSDTIQTSVSLNPDSWRQMWKT